MAELVRTSGALSDLVRKKWESVLDCIITMDESVVSMHIPETKQQAKQWPKMGICPHHQNKDDGPGVL
jgi:hypothetical protein